MHTILTMAKILLATLYSFEPIIAASTKIGADRLILLVDYKPDKTQQKSIDLINDSLGSVLKIDTVNTDVYDIVEVSKETVEIIDSLSDTDEIYVDITAGRKTKALGLLFGAYARISRIKRIMYVKEENKQLVYLPKLSYQITPAQYKIIEYINKNKISSMAEFSENVGVSKAMLYKHVKELKDMDILEETPDGLKLTDYGRIVIL
ncbi:CRISPR locus-related DNA-binding protein [Methanococcus vannielii SB]|uniref:CRISPR locus-related DNA-binding protein n=2 Tax=Methanococcus vannielii TaxID=2187 RepID=A6UNC6_METVS|nr:CRISPR locus-related DNA-binding protein [Methanococcus vannielii SB]